MDDELDLDLGVDTEEINRKDKRINQLSEKFKNAEEARQAEALKAQQAEEARIKAEKEAQFYKSFNQISNKYQGANEYQDKILEKVNSGYDLEDATISILAKEGKFNPVQQPVKMDNPAGGSADTTLHSQGEKTPQEMSKDELKEALVSQMKSGEFRW